MEQIFATNLEDWPALLRSLAAGRRRSSRESAQACNSIELVFRFIIFRRAILKFNRRIFIGAVAQLPYSSGGFAGAAVRRRNGPTFRVKVDMVVLSFTVTDSKGHYINGLKPSDFHLTEDGIPQKINTFGEGNKPPVQVLENGDRAAAGRRPWMARWRQRRIGSPRCARMPSSEPTFSCCSIPATTCIAALSTLPTRSPISCAAWTKPIRWPSTPSAAIFRAPRRSRTTATTRSSACAKPWRATIRRSTTVCC